MRTFIAIELPSFIQEELASHQQVLQQALSVQEKKGVRWTPATNVHLTLRFLGETDAAQRTRLSESLAAIASKQAPFSLHLQGAGCFPHCSKPSVFWLGLGGDLSILHALRATVEEAVQLAGFCAESRPFAPHLTLARVQRKANTGMRRQLGATFQDVSQGWSDSTTFAVTGFVHMRSQLAPTGARYTPLKHFHLGKNL